MIRRLRDAILLDLAAVIAFDMLTGGFRFVGSRVAARRALAFGPVDPSLVGRLVREMFE